MQAVKFIPAAEIEKRASEVLANAGVVSAPVDPVQIAASVGIEVFSIDFADDSICGILRLEVDKYCIYVNQDHHRLRMRYTIAHELGHYFLHRDHIAAFIDKELNLYRSKSLDDATKSDPTEVQANMFAAALLMPEHLLRAAYGVSHDIAHLARMFAVSREAMGHRIINLGLSDGEEEAC